MCTFDLDCRAGLEERMEIDDILFTSNVLNGRFRAVFSCSFYISHKIPSLLVSVCWSSQTVLLVGIFFILRNFDVATLA